MQPRSVTTWMLRWRISGLLNGTATRRALSGCPIRVRKPVKATIWLPGSIGRKAAEWFDT